MELKLKHKPNESAVWIELATEYFEGMFVSVVFRANKVGIRGGDELRCAFPLMKRASSARAGFPFVETSQPGIFAQHYKTNERRLGWYRHYCSCPSTSDDSEETMKDVYERSEPITVGEKRTGSVPGLCTSTELVERQKYIVMLRRDRSRLTPAYAELPATQANLIAATSDCSLRIQYPRGTNSRNAQELCPTDNTHLSCDEGKEHGGEREPTAPPPPRRETAPTTPTTMPRPTPSPTTTTAPPPKVNICDDEEATNVISEDDCGPRVNKVLDKYSLLVVVMIQEEPTAGTVSNYVPFINDEVLLPALTQKRHRGGEQSRLHCF
ncbi:hypothetical protein LSAT2_033030 [Lamellibrachia satsuma]|nr:hypothetical protein LSAT2_033030 [Lamellibrachia satsuma]